MRVLVADDERVLADTVAEGLRQQAIAVDVCYDGQAALDRVQVNRYDVAVLDRDMPLRSGDDVCEHIVRSELNTRVLMLTAASGIRDRVDGLQLGADDYLVKPFAFAEMVARVRSLARRANPADKPVLARAGLVLDVGRHYVAREGQLINLSPKEFAVLQVLLRADGAVVSAEDLLEQAWDENTDPFTNVVRVTLMTLRRKLGDPVIETIPRVGYRITG